MSLKKRRLDAKLTQAEVAKAVHVNDSVVSMWERGLRCPSVPHLRSLAALFHCTMEELLREEAHDA